MKLGFCGIFLLLLMGNICFSSDEIDFSKNLLSKKVTILLVKHITKTPSNKNLVIKKLKNKQNYITNYYKLKGENSNCNMTCKQEYGIKIETINLVFDNIYRSIDGKFSKVGLDFKDIISDSKIAKIKKITGMSDAYIQNSHTYENLGYSFDECMKYFNTTNFGYSKCYYFLSKSNVQLDKPLEIFVYRFENEEFANNDIKKTDFYGSDKKSDIQIQGTQKAVLLKLDCLNKIRTLRLQKNNIVLELKYSLYHIDDVVLSQIVSILIR